jgi:hypothetical protein
MKNTKSSVKKEVRVEVAAASVPLGNKPCLDPFDTSLLGSGVPNYVLDPASFSKDLPPIATPEEEEMLNSFIKEHPEVYQSRPSASSVFHEGTGIHLGFDKEAAWIQTHSGRRFNPTKPNPDAIVIQDIAHALSMQCRFSGHCKEFYSVAQHSVLVSHICNDEDALWGLLHDASEAYLVDVPRPLKQSGKFQTYIDFETEMQIAVCKRFGLPLQEPPSVKRADTKLLATEARDLMSPLHSDWIQVVSPLPFVIETWDHRKAKDMFMQRFFELTAPGESAKMHYEHYLRHRDVL